jgi:excisionase family DNA binding protein
MHALPDPAARPTITVPEAGALLGLGRDAAYRAADRGDIPTLRFGRRIVVPTARLWEMLGLDHTRADSKHVADPTETQTDKGIRDGQRIGNPLLKVVGGDLT